MRKLLCNRYVVLVLLALAAHALLGGDPAVAKGWLFAAGLDWAVAGFPKLFRLPRRARGLAKVVVRSPGGRRDADYHGCFERLDPKWQTWLADPAAAPTEAGRDVR